MADRSDTQNTKSLSGNPVLDKGANGQEIQDPVDPGSNDIDERITQDYKTAIERSRPFRGNRLRQAQPKTASSDNESSDGEDK